MKNFLKAIAKAVLPEPKPPKAPRTQQTVQHYLGGARGSTITDSSRNTANLDLTTLRSASTMNEIIKNLVLNSPDLSAAVHSKIKTAIPSRFTAIAFSAKDGSIDSKATKLLQVFIMRLNTGSYDYSRYTSPTDLRSVASALLYDSFRYGGAALELILGDSRYPAYLNLSLRRPQEPSRQCNTIWEGPEAAP